jgi:hypothetical protein
MEGMPGRRDASPFLGRVCEAVRVRHYRIRTEEAHVLNRGGRAVRSPLGDALGR